MQSTYLQNLLTIVKSFHLHPNMRIEGQNIAYQRTRPISSLSLAEVLVCHSPKFPSLLSPLLLPHLSLTGKRSGMEWHRRLRLSLVLSDSSQGTSFSAADLRAQSYQSPGVWTAGLEWFKAFYGSSFFLIWRNWDEICGIKVSLHFDFYMPTKFSSVLSFIKFKIFGWKHIRMRL